MALGVSPAAPQQRLAPSASAPAGVPSLVDIDMLTVRDDEGLYVAHRDGRTVEIAFPLDLDRFDPAAGHESERLAAFGSVVVMIDRYKVRDGVKPDCVNGYQAFVRVLSLETKRQSFAQPIHCEAGRRPIQDLATFVGPDTLRIETEPKMLRIHEDGSVVAVEAGETN